MKQRAWIILAQLALLFMALAVALLLLEIWVFGLLALIESFAERPVLISVALLGFCAVFLLCIFGARMASRKGISLSSRTILLSISAIAAVTSIEPIYVGFIALAVEPSESYSWLLIGFSLVALATAGIKFSFDWPIPYLILFIAVFALVALSSISIVALNLI